jgi:Ni,Fe-hydrogenase III large subunit
MIAGELIRQLGTIVPARPWQRRSFTPEQWHFVVEALAATPALELVAMWAEPGHIHALFLDPAIPEMLPLSVPVVAGAYPAMSVARPAAIWFERMIHDLWGHVATDGRDARPWLDHGKWDMRHPLAPRPSPVDNPPLPPEFIATTGEDLHQLAVGPIHAGIIEAGHFRFTCAGETVVRLEVRLGYNHKGMLSLLRGKIPRAAARFAARLSGDSTVAHGIAFARAAEAAASIEAPPRAASLRGVMAELERLANHCGDIGTICNDAAFPALNARFGWHREMLLRAAGVAFGHRLMMDQVIPGGVAADIAPDGAATIETVLHAMLAELPELIRVYDDYSSLVDRMTGTGMVAPELAAIYAPGGFIGRAAGQAGDARRFPGYPPYGGLAVTPPLLTDGDVDARVRIRLDEITISAALLRTLLGSLPSGALSVGLGMETGEGFGVAEAFRGSCWHWLRLENGMITGAFMADPSWRQWPLLEAAALGNIVADFPLINKSFNCSYSGVDL